MAPWNFKEWYEKNKPSFNEKRRSRYDSDPEYRARVLELNRKNREKQRAERSKEEKARKKAAKVVASPAWKELQAEAVDGQVVSGDEAQKFVTIGAVARAVRRSTQSIRLWEKEGVIPETPYRSTRGDRLYTPQMVLDIIAKAKEQKGLEPVDHRSEIVAIDAQVKKVDGSMEAMKLFRVGVLAQAVGRTVLTLEQMERKGVFPATPLRDPRTGHRYYTADMIESVKNIFDDMGGVRLRGEDRKAEFNARVTNEWTTQGIIGATVCSTEPTQKEAVSEEAAG